MTSGRNFFDKLLKNDDLTYNDIQNITTSQEDDYTTGCLLEYPSFLGHYRMIAIDLNKHQALDAHPKAIQQSNFTGNEDWVGDAIMC